MSWVEYQGCPTLNLVTSESDSTPPLVGSAPPSVACMGQAGNQEVAEPPRCQPLDQGEDSLGLTLLKMVLETCQHPPQSKEELIQMGIPQQVKHLVAITTEGGGKVRNILHPQMWTCRFLNQLTLTQM